jgi:SAM-dependent methyltransferase
MKNIYLKISDLIIKMLSLDYLFVKKIIRREIPDVEKICVLDFGCGTGVLTDMFIKSSYLGFDLDRDAVFFAKENHPGFKFMVGDATTFKIDKKFDLVLVVGVLHHLDDLQVNRALKGIKNLLKRKGKLLAIEAVYPIKSFNIIGTLLRKFDKGSYVRTLRGYSKLLSERLKVVKKYEQKGGLLDYAVFVASH